MMQPETAQPTPATGHRRRRLREKVLIHGAEPLADAELLAILMRGCAPGSDPIGLAQAALHRFGGLQPLLAADACSFNAQPGLGPAGWAALQAARELLRRAALEQLQHQDILCSPGSVRTFLGLWLRDRPAETFVGLFLDNRNRVIAALELFRGTLTQTAVYPREVARHALRLNAAAVIFAHNHPSGANQPSQADRTLTEALRSALAQIDVAVLDHLIVAGNQCLSFAEHGWI